MRMCATDPSSAPTDPRIPGFTLLRLLSDRESSRLFLARGDTGELCAIKLQRPSDPANLRDLVNRDAKLQHVTRTAGLLQVSAHGVTGDGWAWHSLPLADNLPGLPPLTTDWGLRQYTAFSLGAWRANSEQNPAPARQIAQWGARLATALAALHNAGLVHRDVKPGNVLFSKGEPCLGDYGLAGEAGQEADYRGTEGFRPVEGTNDAGADLFGLGRTLYEVWTGCNRLEFPSLPREVLDAPDWDAAGRYLNEVLVRACNQDPAERFHSAEEFSKALDSIISGGRPMSRRRWLVTSLGCVVGGAGLFLFLERERPPARVVWRRVRKKGFNVESWTGNSTTADWGRGQMYSFSVGSRGRTFEALDLERFTLTDRSLSEGPSQEVSAIFHPKRRELWAIDGGGGEVFALNPTSLRLRSLGGGPEDDRHFSARTYWNPVSGRVGIFGGYGYFKVRNDRREFDPASKRWLEIEPDRDGPGPWRREGNIPLIPDSTGAKLYLVGGNGSRSGKQGDQMAGVPWFNGRFHVLDDIWELDLRSNAWRCLLPLGHFDPMRLHMAAWFPSVGGLVMFEGLDVRSGKAPPTSGWLLRPGRDHAPVRLPMAGDISRLAVPWCWTLDPRNGELLMFADDGIFRISVIAAGARRLRFASSSCPSPPWSA
jgi:serine/threonine protein kinase